MKLDLENNSRCISCLKVSRDPVTFSRTSAVATPTGNVNAAGAKADVVVVAVNDNVRRGLRVKVKKVDSGSTVDKG
jgi:hypothetical protein